MKPETRFRKSKVIPVLLKLKNAAYFPIQQLAILGDADFVVCMHGWFIWLELKDDGQELRPLQKKKAAWVTKCGGIVLVATPKNWGGVAEWLHVLDSTGKVLPYGSYSEIF